jgi:UDP-glucose:(heptosyl)LPS alpha-1,3-glucosyltransferase
MKLVFVAHRIAKIGGMERAASEVCSYLAERHRLGVVTTLTDLPDEKVEKCIVRMPKLPAILASYWFRHKARQQMRGFDPASFISVGAAAWPVDVMVVQFCHAAFWKLPANVRSNSIYQKIAAAAFMREERVAVRSPRLKGMIAVSKGVAREMIERYGYPTDRVKVVPNGVDTDLFRPISAEEKITLRRKHGLPEKSLLAIFVGGDWSRKGLDFAIEAMQGLRDCHLLVVGGGGKERPDFIRKAAAAGLRDRVTFFGRSERPWEMYQMADVCVQPTYYEAFSLVSLEAAGSGLPVIMPDINGATDLVTEGYNGFICERSADAIHRLLQELSTNRARLEEMSRASREVSLKFSWPEVGARFEDALRELLGQGFGGDAKSLSA